MDSSDTILVAEDSEPIRKLVSAILARFGFFCLEAADGAEALRLVEEYPAVKLVITDIVMPRMSGPQLARRLTVERPDIRLIFMSGYSDDPLVRALERSPAFFLVKPFTVASLVGLVHGVLARPWNGLPEAPAAALRSAGT